MAAKFFTIQNVYSFYQIIYTLNHENGQDGMHYTQSLKTIVGQKITKRGCRINIRYKGKKYQTIVGAK